ncbi:TIR domain-containing protein, partial [Rhodoplanes sp. SY1]|uniref:TIR domain-containing protein n=1 Tax=Rhodoplanes sp. SY1 TaxID=3166646 RepID=UPI0038B51448
MLDIRTENCKYAGPELLATNSSIVAGLKMRPRLFIGSSGERLDVAQAIQQELDRDAEVTVWNQGVFELTKSTLESLTSEIANTDFCIFVFEADDIVRIRGASSPVVRDNVIFELGLAIGSLGRSRCFIIKPRNYVDLHLPSDLSGITVADYDANRSDGRIRAAVASA